MTATMKTSLLSDEPAHSVLGPSAAHRWRACPGSVNAENGLPDKAGREAAQGTVFHTYAELCAVTGLLPDVFELGTVHHVDGYDVPFDQDMIDYMLPGLEWIAEHSSAGTHLFVETRVDISSWVGEPAFGTSDIIIADVAERHVVIFDWKYGQGIPVAPEHNDQMFLYALGAWSTVLQDLFKGVSPHEIVVTCKIEQPRAPGGGGEWRITMQDVLDEGDMIRLDANRTRAENAPRIAGEKQCAFCKASGRCDEQARFNLDTFGMKFEDLDFFDSVGAAPSFEDLTEFTPERRAYVVLHHKAFSKFVDRARAFLLEDLRAGRAVGDVKLVHGRRGRSAYRIADLQTVEQLLVEKLGEKTAIIKKLISPSEAKKKLHKVGGYAEIAAYVEEGVAKPIIVARTDARPAVATLPEMFDDLDEENGNENED